MIKISEKHWWSIVKRIWYLLSICWGLLVMPCLVAGHNEPLFEKLSYGFAGVLFPFLPIAVWKLGKLMRRWVSWVFRREKNSIIFSWKYFYKVIFKCWLTLLCIWPVVFLVIDYFVPKNYGLEMLAISVIPLMVLVAGLIMILIAWVSFFILKWVIRKPNIDKKKVVGVETLEFPDAQK